jgi:hypothetical protein
MPPEQPRDQDRSGEVSGDEPAVQVRQRGDRAQHRDRADHRDDHRHSALAGLRGAGHHPAHHVAGGVGTATAEGEGVPEEPAPQVRGSLRGCQPGGEVTHRVGQDEDADQDQRPGEPAAGRSVGDDGVDGTTDDQG